MISSSILDNTFHKDQGGKKIDSFFFCLFAFKFLLFICISLSLSSLLHPGRTIVRDFYGAQRLSKLYIITQQVGLIPKPRTPSFSLWKVLSVHQPQNVLPAMSMIFRSQSVVLWFWCMKNCNVQRKESSTEWVLNKQLLTEWKQTGLFQQVFPVLDGKHRNP